MLTILSVAWCAMVVVGALAVFEMPPVRTFTRPLPLVKDEDFWAMVPEVFMIPEYMENWPLVSASVIWEEEEEEEEIFDKEIEFSDEGGIYLVQNEKDTVNTDHELGDVTIAMVSEPTIPGDNYPDAVEIHGGPKYLAMGKTFQEVEITIDMSKLLDNDLLPQPLTMDKIVWKGKGKYAGESWEQYLQSESTYA